MFTLEDLQQEATRIDQAYRTAVDALARRDDLTMPGKVARSALSWQRFGSKRATVILISWRRCCTI